MKPKKTRPLKKIRKQAKVKKQPKAAAKKAAKPAYSVFLDPLLCKGCQICIEVCPKGVFEKTDRISTRGHLLIRAARPAECIGCLECEALCPDLAITIEKQG